LQSTSRAFASKNVSGHFLTGNTRFANTGQSAFYTGSIWDFTAALTACAKQSVQKSFTASNEFGQIASCRFGKFTDSGVNTDKPIISALPKLDPRNLAIGSNIGLKIFLMPSKIPPTTFLIPPHMSPKIPISHPFSCTSNTCRHTF
jgi:hypothetical protein